MLKKELITIYEEYNSASELSTDDQLLISEAKNILGNAYAPYSNFKVAAAVLLKNGKIVTGTNQENAAYPSGLCAERVAMFYANSQYPNVGVATIAICAENKNGIIPLPVPPCGSCRQVLYETEQRYGSPVKTILIGTEKIFVIQSIAQLLPLHFTNDYLLK